jgi:predicted nucleic acid-binding protein
VAGGQPLENPVPDDPKDDMVAATAVAAGADYLVTGDRRHLLSLGDYKGIRIVTPRQFLDLITRSD